MVFRKNLLEDLLKISPGNKIKFCSPIVKILSKFLISPDDKIF